MGSKRKGQGGGGKQKFQGRSLSGMNSIHGILFTCPSDREREARREAYSLIEEVVEEMSEDLPPYEPKSASTAVKTSDTVAEKAPENMESKTENTDTSNTTETVASAPQPIVAESKVDQNAELKQEIDDLKNDKRIDMLETQIKGVIFLRIRDNRISAVEVVRKLMASFVESEANIKARFLYRMIPVSTTCYASEENIKNTAELIVPTYFSQYNSNTFKKYCVQFKTMNSNAITRTKAYELIGSMIKYYHFVELKNPQVVIFVYLIKSMCLISLVDNYESLHDLNINAVRKWHESKRAEASVANTITPVPVPAQTTEAAAAPSTETAVEGEPKPEEPKEEKKAKRKTTEETGEEPKKKKKKVVGGIRLL